MSLLALMVALCIFLSFRQRIQSYLIKKQCNYTWKRHNKYNHTCYHSQRIQLNFLIYHFFHRELRCLRHKIHMGLFLTFLLAGIAMLTSCLMFCLFFIFFVIVIVLLIVIYGWFFLIADLSWIFTALIQVKYLFVVLIQIL